MKTLAPRNKYLGPTLEISHTPFTVSNTLHTQPHLTDWKLQLSANPAPKVTQKPNLDIARALFSPTTIVKRKLLLHSVPLIMVNFEFGSTTIRS